MKTVYNLKLDVENISDRVSYNDALNTLKAYYTKGLIGPKHVDSFGRIRDGYDDECEVTKKGVYRIKIAPELEKIVNVAEEMSTEGISAVQQQNAHKSVLRQLGNYFSFKYSIETPVGRQSTRAYINDGKTIDDKATSTIKILRLNKNFMYDQTALMGYLTNIINGFDTASKTLSADLNVIQIVLKKRMQRQRSRIMDLYIRLIGTSDDIKAHELLLLRRR